MLKSRTMIAGILGAALLASAGVVAAANLTDDASAPAAAHDETFVSPVIASDLFRAEKRKDCMPGDAVIARFESETASAGGRVFVLADGLEQAFADAWRYKADLGPVAVSSVVAHLFQAPDGAGYMVDVVEIDGAGCAMSRTILSGGDWNMLLRSAMGAEA
jgi:hypothetical protein